MSDPEDSWPLPEYNPGQHDHLHAIGVICLTYNAFEGSMSRLYRHHPDQLRMPFEITDTYYWAQSEQRRFGIIKTMFDTFEKEDSVKQFVYSAADFYQWAWKVRNIVLHAEPYPPSAFVSRKADAIHLAKRTAKTDPETKYVSYSLGDLRGMADRIANAIKAVAGANLYLRYRDIPFDQLPLSLRALEPEPLPEKLAKPPDPTLHPRPKNVPEHIFLRIASRQSIQ